MAVRQLIKHKHQGSLPNIRLEFYSSWKKHIFQMTIRNLASIRKQPLMSPLKKISFVSFFWSPSLTVSSLSLSQLGMERQCHYLYSSSLIQSYRLEDSTLNSTYGKKTLGTKTLIAALFTIVLNGEHLRSSAGGERLSKLRHLQMPGLAWSFEEHEKPRMACPLRKQRCGIHMYM